MPKKTITPPAETQYVDCADAFRESVDFGMIQPQACDIAEELQGNEALMEFRRDMASSEG